MTELQTTFCIQFGYNLRGSESRRCPECGADNSEEQVQQHLKALMVDPFVARGTFGWSLLLVVGLALAVALAGVTRWGGILTFAVVLTILIMHEYRQTRRFELADRLVEDRDELRPPRWPSILFFTAVLIVWKGVLSAGIICVVAALVVIAAAAYRALYGV